MAKTNFTKVESSVESAMMRMKMEELVLETKKLQKESKNPKHFIINSLRYDFEELPRIDKGCFKKLGINRKDIKKLISKPEALTDKDWEFLKEIRSQVDKIKKELLKKFPQPTDEELVELERLKHINKRFN